MQKRLTVLTLMLLALIVVASVGVPAVTAQIPPLGGEQDTIVNDDDILTFTELGLSDRVLRGPYDTFSTRFNIPPTWDLTTEASIELELGDILLTNPVASAEGQNLSGAVLEVSFNDQVVDNVLLDLAANTTINIPLPPDALVSPRDDGAHEMSLFLDASIDCEFDNQTTVVIGNNTEFRLRHELIAPSTDVRRLPAPMFQPSSFLPSRAIIVTPGNPTPEELSAAFVTAAAFGRMTSGDMIAQLVPTNEITELQRNSEHLILVGRASGLDLLDNLDLPLPASAQGFALDDAEDGIVQMVVSPWNEEKVVLVVSGNTDEGVQKAAKALSAEQLRTGDQTNLSVIAAVQNTQYAPPAEDNRTLADLGYDTVTLRGIGTSGVDYNFYMPPGLALGTGAFFQLNFRHSAILNYERSGLNVSLNGQPIGSARFSDETSQAGTVQVQIPAYAVVPGNNRIQVATSLVPTDACADLALNDLSATFTPDSVLNLPLVSIQTTSVDIQDLSEYPRPFINSPTLGGTALVVPVDDSQSWNIAAVIAADLGKRINGPVVELTAAYANAVPDDVLNSRDLLIVGLPTELPIINTIGDAMPAPFELGSNYANERNSQIVFRFPEGTDIGYLQLLPAPWQPAHAVMAVLGSTEEGLIWAANGLLDSGLRAQLSGDFAAVNGDQVTATDTRIEPDGTRPTPVPAPINVEPLTEDPQQAVPARPVWMLPVLGAAVALVIVLVVVAAVVPQLRRRGS